MGEAPAKAVMETVVEMVEPLDDDDRRRQAEMPRRAPPIGKVFGISIARRIGRGVGRRRNLIDLRRQPRRILGNSPTPIGLLAGLDDRLLLLSADGHLNGVAAASGFRRGGLGSRA